MIRLAGVGEPLRKPHAIADARQCLVGTAEQPLAPGCSAEGANPGIVPPVEQRLRPMPLGIIEAAARVAMSSARRGLAIIHLGSPTAHSP